MSNFMDNRKAVVSCSLIFFNEMIKLSFVYKKWAKKEAEDKNLPLRASERSLER